MAKELENINLSILSDTTRHVIQERLAGKTYAEIGNSLGVSRQCIEQRVSRAIKKDAKIKQRTYLSSDQIKKLCCFKLIQVSKVAGISYSRLCRAARHEGYIYAHEMQLLMEFLGAS